MKVFMSAAFSVLIASVSFAEEPAKTDPAPFKFLGFSRDAHFAAFSYSMYPIESGIYKARTVFIDVEKNALAAPSVLTEGQDRRAVEDRNTDEAAKTLKRLGIDGGLEGEELYSHAPILGYNSRSTEEALSRDPGQLALSNLTLSLFPKAGLSAPHCKDPEHTPIGLRLTAKEAKDSKVTVLQSDKKIPSGRKCPERYGFRAVHRYNGAVLVMLFVLSPGFEGFPEVDYMAISGRLGGT